METCMKEERTLARLKKARVAWRCMACVVALAVMPGLAGAQDRAADLREAAERVAVLATAWEPDLAVALQGVAPGLQAMEMA